ncbi:hypothetical protein EFP84_04385 [Leptospira kmetyi]|uniref:Uncharacterized protein n=1 Tax=Leptospira kmetyi TaxID=408139 RepID=A0A5F1XKC8_9LEPT|nr:hypothetical protein [Leptospira kmetyi]AYV54829.1 hypothetical protein EFP84_04385 [Leptospira kmetyi]TGK13511.1 hypothetical protein EHO62_17380 [Leptospira kmetyi]TGK31225.1 hypothetical protein EHO66_08865 [Leptospira kmetyi]TGL68608.1 hypothetical protein EHQ67_11075 [Leptospira kmetyi]
MRRDQLKILLSGILVLLLGSLIVYSYLFREDISRFLKKKEGEEVSSNSKTDRVILSPEMNSEPPISPNDLNSLPTEEKKGPTSGEFSANEKENPTSKENKSLKEEWPEEKHQRSVEKTPKEKTPEEKWNPPKDETNVYKDEEPKKRKIEDSREDWETKADRKSKKHRMSSGKKSGTKKNSSVKTGKRIRSLETRVNRLERKLGISHTKKKHKTRKSDKRSLEKRVQKLEREMEKLKTKE